MRQIRHSKEEPISSLLIILTGHLLTAATATVLAVTTAIILGITDKKFTKMYIINVKQSQKITIHRSTCKNINTNLAVSINKIKQEHSSTAC